MLARNQLAATVWTGFHVTTGVVWLIGIRPTVMTVVAMWLRGDGRILHTVDRIGALRAAGNGEHFTVAVVAICHGFTHDGGTATGTLRFP